MRAQGGVACMMGPKAPNTVRCTAHQPAVVRVSPEHVAPMRVVPPPGGLRLWVWRVRESRAEWVGLLAGGPARGVPTAPHPCVRRMRSAAARMLPLPLPSSSPTPCPSTPPPGCIPGRPPCSQRSGAAGCASSRTGGGSGVCPWEAAGAGRCRYRRRSPPRGRGRGRGQLRWPRVEVAPRVAAAPRAPAGGGLAPQQMRVPAAAAAGAAAVAAVPPLHA